MKRFFGPLGWSDERLKELDASYLRYLVRWTLDMGRLFHRPPSELGDWVELHGEEALRSALSGGRGVLLVGTHLGTFFKIPCSLAARGFQVHVAFNSRSFHATEDYFGRLARRHGFHLAFLNRNAALTAMRALRNNEIYLAAFDVSVRKQQSTVLKFGHSVMRVDTGLAELAARARCPVLLCHCLQLAEGRSRVSISPLSETDASDFSDPNATCEVWLQSFYRQLLEFPEQWWLWSSSRGIAATETDAAVNREQ